MWILKDIIRPLNGYLSVKTKIESAMNTITANDNAKTLSLIAPMSGPLVQLEQVPDPVFAQKMVGDGISIDPVTPSLLAPCSGKVIQLHRAGHAVTLKTTEGIEVMMHIGLETVALNGEGFKPLVTVGDQVGCGDVLIEFDADFVAASAKSLLTQLIITNSDQVLKFLPARGFVEAGRDCVLELVLDAKTGTKQKNQNTQSEISEPIIIPNPTGLHARPSAVLTGAAKAFAAEIVLKKGDRQANAKSLVSIMALEVCCGDQVCIEATGNDAIAAINCLVAHIKAGLGEDCQVPELPGVKTPVLSNECEGEEEPVSDANLLQGVTASPGLAVGNIYQLRRTEITVPERLGDADTERELLNSAVVAAREQLQALQQQMGDPDKAAIFSAHQELLVDPELEAHAHDRIGRGKSAAFAWREAYTEQAKQLAALNNDLLAARANDLRDVGDRVLRLILGLDTETQALPDNTILIAEDLTPSDTATLDRSKVLGFCTVTGGASSHVAILARSMAIPAIAGIEPRALSLDEGAPVILDAAKGCLRLNPSEEEVESIQQRIFQLAAKRKADLATALEPAVTRDKHRVEVVANIAQVEEARESLAKGGEGVGLLRSEFLFMNRAAAPSEDEQFRCYAETAQILGPDRPLIIRTLDVGGDKPLHYLPIATEENPFLGLRGIRVMLQRKDLFRTQLRAILRASEQGNIKVMFPMVTTMGDLHSAKALLEEERKNLGIAPVEMGIMVEVPTTALMAEQFARHVDFFSIGTNDLAQYTLAIDRGHPELAHQADGLNPGVLHLIAHTVKGAHKHGKWVGVCGGIASDPQAVPILLGLGVDELSVSVPAIPAIKAQVREWKLSEGQALAARALQRDTAEDVRALVADMEDENNQPITNRN